SLRTISERYRGQPLAGILLLTDGNATDIAAATFDNSGLPPVYPVLIGDNEPARDIAISNVKISQSSFEDAPVTIQADVAHSGYSGASFVAKVIEVASRGNTNATNIAAAPQTTVAEQTMKTANEGELVPFRFQVKPDKSGVLFYRLQVGAKNEQDEFANPQVTTEATLANNTRTLVVD